MSSQIDFEQFEMKNRLRNKNRTLMLIRIYDEPQRYQDLIELTSLKPGSIYHHLKILGDLIEKKDHGTYMITDLGKQVVEHFGLVNVDSIKPKISQNNSEIISEDLLSNIWIGYSSLLLLFFILAMTVLLGSEGVSLAGSAIYYIGFPESFIFDIVAIFMGWIFLVLVFLIQGSKDRREYLFETSLIRSLSMLPGSIIGVTIYLLFLFDNSPSQAIFDLLFGVTLILGLVLSSTGVYYFKNKTMKDSILIAIIPSSIDLLLGMVIFLMN